MKEIEGKFNKAKIFTDDVDEKSLDQIETLCNQEFTQNAKIRLMPDVHAGAGCTIGTTMTIQDKIVPNLVGVDIGCGMETLVIKADSQVSEKFSGEKLDKIIRKNIPSGFNIRKFPHKFVEEIDWKNIRGKLNVSQARMSLGTLGGGNHFIEADRDEKGNLYIVIHSGSRHAGLEIAHYYQDLAWKQLNENTKEDIENLIAELKNQGRDSEIESKILEVNSQVKTKIPYDLAYLSGQYFDDYINDMKIMQKFAELNRKAMIDTLCIGLRLDKCDIIDQFTTIHNYIDTDSMILRKGAVSAKNGEKLLIPINMRDGSLICIGKGNEDWNYSAPHGAGRVLSRIQAKKQLSMEKFKIQMKGIYSTSIKESTLDESPMAYKPIKSILSNIEPTAEVVNVIKPIYNFKS